MDRIIIRGGKRLEGRIPISGAKNAALLAIAILAHRRAAEFAGPDHERVFQQAALLEIGQQRRDRLIGLAAAIGEPEVQRLVG